MLNTLRFILRLRFAPIALLNPIQCERSLSFSRFFATEAKRPQTNDLFVNIPQEELQIEVNKYKAIGGDSSPKEVTSRVVISFNVNEAEWMPQTIKEVFKKQQMHHIDDTGLFTIVSTMHRSTTANRVEVMRKLQKKVNQACISQLDIHTIGVVIDPIARERRQKEKMKRSELSRKRHNTDKDYDLEEML